MMDNYNVGASQFAGGGFMPTQGNTDAGGFNSPAQRKAGAQTQSLRAVTVKQLFDGTRQSSDDMHEVDGQEIQNVTLVGRLESVQELATQLKLVLDDGTGTVEVRHWIDSDQGEALANKKAEWRAGVYVRVHGNVRTFDSIHTVAAFNIRPILDFNEVTYHMLSCIFQHVHFTKGSAAGQANAGGLGAGAQQQAAQLAGPHGGGGGFGLGNGAMGMGMGGDDHRTPVQRAVIQTFQAADVNDSQGITANEVVNALSGKFSAQQIRDAVQHLVDEGHAYSTIDDFHFKYSGMQM